MSSFRPLSLYPVADCPCWGPLSLYLLAVSAISYVPFISVPRRGPSSSHPFQVFRLSRVPSGPRRSTSLRNFHFLAEMAPCGPWKLQAFSLKGVRQDVIPGGMRGPSQASLQASHKGSLGPPTVPKGPTGHPPRVRRVPTTGPRRALLGPPRGPEGAPRFPPGGPKGPLGPWGPRRCAPAV